MIQRGIARHLAIALLCVQGAIAACAGTLAHDRMETFPIILKDGTTLHAAKEPLAAFGGVRATLTDGRFVVIEDAKVDMERTRAAWFAAAAWAMLDHAKLQGKAFPAFVAADPNGAAVRFEPATQGLTFVEVWSGF